MIVLSDTITNMCNKLHQQVFVSNPIPEIQSCALLYAMYFMLLYYAVCLVKISYPELMLFMWKTLWLLTSKMSLKYVSCGLPISNLKIEEAQFECSTHIVYLPSTNSWLN